MLASMTSHNVRGALPLGQSGPPASMFPHRTRCTWVEQSEELSVRLCDDGTITMWRDIYGNAWLPSTKPPKRWRKAIAFFKKNPDAIHLGAAPVLHSVGQLQSALEALSRRVDDHNVQTTMDGKMGPRTAEATNRALKLYASTAPGTLRSGHLSEAVIVRNVIDITRYINAAHTIGARVTSGIFHPRPPQTTTPIQTQLQPAAAPGGAGAMPAPGYYPPPSGYYPPSGYAPSGYAPRGPGGLPPDRASVDVRAFIPAQYEHVRIEPSWAMFGLAAVVVLFLVKQRKGEKKRD